ncbi:hypothetical protein FJT64_001032 [Amphibalanus amphitrite]|uniref:RNase H type-1 domain-containing protein n=1 Tax=Amphibalanus amphitrite TaxID=1232801 RepID=A0A6A4VCD2_AMPAM|nr:hypothetical protein FJT64_001032 [Amphibalanus amphitrite]
MEARESSEGGAFTVWSQMPAASRGSLVEVQETLYAAFAMDSFAAYDAFCCRRLRTGESPDVFLSDLRRLAFGLECKPPERAAAGARLLGLHVRAVGGVLRWARDNVVGPPPVTLTRRSVFAWCGRLVAHLPVCGWLRPAAAWLKRRANAVTNSWDQPTDDATLRQQIDYVASRLARDDPAHGRWHVEGDHAVVWTDASSIAAGVVLETPTGDPIEDGCWLRRDETAHINMAELDAAVRGINLAIAWEMRRLDLRTDSATVHRWISDALSGRSRLKTKAHGEMIIRRRIDMVKQLVDEFGIDLSVTLVPTAHNRADCLTRVPVEWVRGDDPSVGDPAVAAAVVGPVTDAGEDDAHGADAGVVEDTVGTRESSAISEVHAKAGHPGIRRTLYFARGAFGVCVRRFTRTELTIGPVQSVGSVP